MILAAVAPADLKRGAAALAVFTYLAAELDMAPPRASGR